MRNVILALLAAGATHGYEIKRAFEARVGSILPPVNIGQIYTTLQRLERDGLVSSKAVPQKRRPDRKVYRLTGAGLEELDAWFNRPATGPKLRDDFFLRMVMARSNHQAGESQDPVELIQRQTREYLQELRDLDDVKTDSDTEDGRIQQLLIEGAALHLQADLRWMEICETALRKESGQ